MQKAHELRQLPRLVICGQFKAHILSGCGSDGLDSMIYHTGVALADTLYALKDGVVRFFVRSQKTEVFNWDTKERVYYEEA